MRRLLPWIAAVLVAGAMETTAPLPAAHGAEIAADSAAVSAPQDTAAAQETLTASEDIAVLKALAPLSLTQRQLTDLLPALQGAQAKLGEVREQQATKLAAWETTLEQSRRDLLVGKSTGMRTSEQFGLAQLTAAQKEITVRSELISSLQATLQKTLTPDQQAQVAESGQAVLMAQRMANRRAGGGPGGWAGFGGPGGRGRGGPGGPGGPGGGPNGPNNGPGLGGPGNRGGMFRGDPGAFLDQMRLMSPADFQAFAEGRSNRMGGQDSPQYQQFVTFMNQVRDMPQSQYLLQRDQLAAQSFGRGGFRAAATDPEATKAFIDRYLLSPRAPVVVSERLQPR